MTEDYYFDNFEMWYMGEDLIGYIILSETGGYVFKPKSTEINIQKYIKKY